MKPERRSLTSAAALLVLASGCTSGPEPDLPDVDLVTPVEAPAATESPAPEPGSSIATGASDAPGRIVVLDELGALLTFDPDGSDVVVLAEAVPGETLVRQPTWSPDGERIAWVRFPADEETTAKLVTTGSDGARPRETAMAVIPFYLAWDPTSSRVAYLGSSPSGEIELGVAEATGDEGPTALDAGTPLFLSWNPLGDELIVHIGADRLDRLEVGGTATPVGERPGTFTVPVWTSDGRSLLYVSRQNGGQQLVAHDLERERATPLVRFDGSITFVVSPDGRRVAFQVAEGPGDVGPLSILDRETGAVERVVDEISPAYFWSPDGARLLYVLPEQVGEGFWFRWGVWDGASSFTTARFYPSEVFARDYLRFFEQYAQSMTLWSPDASAFTYAGVSESGEAGVWIQPAVEGVDPVLVTGGTFASWSPA